MKDNDQTEMTATTIPGIESLTDQESNGKKKKTPSAESAVSEFKVTIKKLDVPVRPRGVLAE